MKQTMRDKTSTTGSIILGIDPGYAILGYGAIEARGNTMKAIDCGVIETTKDEAFPERLERLYIGTKMLADRFNPDCIVFEELFFARNTTTAMFVAAARGVTMLAAYETGLPLYEYTPMQIKLAVCGNGHAKKPQVQDMIKRLLKLDHIPKPDDAADGLAAAVCHSNMMGVSSDEYRIK